MEFETYKKPKKNNFWLIVILIFIGILGFLIYTSFYNPELGKSVYSITGNVIGFNNDKDSIKINAILTSPEKIRVNGKIEKIELKILGDFIIGKENFDLNEASVVIDEFDGWIISGKNNLTANGNAKKVFVEGIPINPITDKSDIKVIFDNDYNYLKLTNFYLDSFSYKTSGSVKLNNEKAIINLEKENFKIENFRGNLEIAGNRFELNGEISKSNLGFIDIKAGTIKNKDTNNSK